MAITRTIALRSTVPKRDHFPHRCCAVGSIQTRSIWILQISGRLVLTANGPLRATFTQYKRFRTVVGAVTESYGAEHSAYLPELVRYHDYSMILFGRLFCRARAGIERFERNRMVL